MATRYVQTARLHITQASSAETKRRQTALTGVEVASRRAPGKDEPP
jgi:hypothetical protein